MMNKYECTLRAERVWTVLVTVQMNADIVIYVT
jgi:hypothetical protein